MTTTDSGPNPEGGGPPDDAGELWPTGSQTPREVGRQALRGLVTALFGRVMLFHGLFWLLLGGGLLAGAWALAQEEMSRRELLAVLTGRAPGTLETPWWRLDFDHRVLGDGTNWRALTRAQACARLRYRPEGGEETTTAYCRRFRGGIRGGHLFTQTDALGPVPARWVDEAGMPRIELRLSPRLARWLEERGPEADPFHGPESFAGPERARRADRLLGSLWREIDDPFLHLLEEWSKPPPRVVVAYLPEDPARAVPLPLLTREFTVPTEGAPMPGWVLAIPLGAFGLIACVAGSHLVSGGRRWAILALVVAELVVVPWTSGRLGKVSSHLWGDAELALAFIQTEMLDLPPELELAAPELESEPGTVRLAWTLGHSSYSELLGWIELEPPAGAVGDDGVLRHLVEQVSRQAGALADEELAALLAWAASVQERGAGEEIGLLFIEAAADLVTDETRSGDVRGAAGRLLQAVAHYEPSTNPYRLAVAERRRLLARLPGR